MRGSSRGRHPLWTCPKCGVKLVTRYLWHSRGEATLSDWLARMGPKARRLYDRFERMIARCGPYHTAPAKTRIAFLARVRFAGITALSEAGMTCGFALPHPLKSPRFSGVEEVVPGWWFHRLRITEAEQLDASVPAWLRQSYHLMGMQQRLDSPPALGGGRFPGPNRILRVPTTKETEHDDQTREAPEARDHHWR